MGHKSGRVGGGIATYSNEIVHALRARGHHVTYFHHLAPGQPELPEEVSLSSVSLGRTAIYSPPAARRSLVEALGSGRFDAVHASLWFSSLDFALPRICREAGVPLVVTFHLAFGPGPSVWAGVSSALYRLYASVLRESDRVIVFSKAQAELMVEMGVSPAATRVIANGVDTAKFRPGPSDGRARLAAERYLIYLGRIDPEKNVGQLIRAFLEVDPPAGTKLAVVGSGTERLSLQRRFPDPRVVFLGHVSDEAERISLLRGADAFILPSSVEGLSLAMLEAMSCGIATVVTNTGSDGETVRGAGVVLELEELRAELACVIRLLLELPWLCRRLGAEARRRVERSYSLERNVDSLVELYRALPIAHRPLTVAATTASLGRA